MTTNTVIPEIDSLKTRLQTIWTAGSTIDSHDIWKAVPGISMNVSRSRRDAGCWTWDADRANSR